MKRLPSSVIEARDHANSCSDKLQDAWDTLNKIDSPSLQDLESWLLVRKEFQAAQESFEEKLKDFIRSGLNA